MIPLATAGGIESFGLVVLAALIGGWLLAGSERMRWIFGPLVIVLSPLVLAGSVVGDKTSSLPALSPAVIALLLAGGAALLALAAALFVRWPRAVVPAALATLAFRVPIELGGDSVKLLLPLYLTIGGAVVAGAWSQWRGRTPATSRPPKLLDVAIVTYLALYALQSLYSHDVAVAVQNFCFFYAPFALLYGLACRQRWDARLLKASVVTLVVVALLLVLGGFVEFARGRYLLSFGGAQPSDFDPYFRVQSFFFDPNIYGRFLVIVMLLVTAVMLYTQKTQRVLGSALILALLWAGLVLSLSQSSFAALLAGLVTLAALRWKTRPVLLTTAAIAVAGVLFVLLVPSLSGIDLSSGKRAEATTSGRFDLITGGLTLWSNKPIFGQGSGDFSNAYRADDLARNSAFGPVVTTKSHTAPLTVLAEQGVVGFAAFVFLLVTGFGAVFRRVRPGDDDRVRPGLVARVGVAAAFTAIFVHTLAYAAFLEDPLTWVLLGCAVSLAAIPRPTAAGEDPPAP
jgi:O-antigen ligase